jgi:hypothetical protein
MAVIIAMMKHKTNTVGLMKARAAFVARLCSVCGSNGLAAGLERSWLDFYAVCGSNGLLAVLELPNLPLTACRSSTRAIPANDTNS